MDKWQVVEMIRKWETSKRPIRVIIAETPVNLAMVIEDFKVGRAEGDGSGDVSFPLNCWSILFKYTAEQAEGKQKRGKDKLKDRPDERKTKPKPTKLRKATRCGIWLRSI